MVASDALAARWPDAERRRLGGPGRARGGAAARRRPARGLRARPTAGWSTSAALKAVSRGVFEDTFAVTVALNGADAGGGRGRAR